MASRFKNYASGTMRLGAYLRAPTPRDSLSVPSNRAKRHSDRAVRPLRCSRRRPRRAHHHRHPGPVGRRGAVRARMQAHAWDSGLSAFLKTHKHALSLLDHICLQLLKRISLRGGRAIALVKTRSVRPPDLVFNWQLGLALRSVAAAA